MNEVFISGSISIKKLPKEVVTSLELIEIKKIKVLVGDAIGLDTLVQTKLKNDRYNNVEVTTIYDTPRNIVSDKFSIKKVEFDKALKSEREKQTYKDIYMTHHSDYSFVIWDGKSKGSYSNILRGLECNKLLKIFLLTENRFLGKSEITMQYIEEIYAKNNGYTLSGIFKEMKAMGILANFKNPNQLKQYFIDRRVIIETKDSLVPSKEYENYFIIENYRGHKTIKYTPQVLNIIQQGGLFS